MNIAFLIRAIDALMTAILCLLAGVGALVAIAAGQWLALAVALAIVLEGALLARRVLRI